MVLVFFSPQSAPAKGSISRPSSHPKGRSVIETGCERALAASGLCPGPNGIRCSPLYKQTGLVDHRPADETTAGGRAAAASGGAG